MRRVSLLVVVAALAACGDDVAGRETISSRGLAPAAAPTVKQASAPGVAVPTLVRGRAIEAWVEDLKSDDEAVRSAAETALREAGDVAVPSLLARFFDEGYLFFEDDAIVRLIADRREAAIPDVLARLEAGAETKWPHKPMELLQWIGESGGFGDRAPLVVETLLRRLDDDDSVRLLGHCGAAAERAVPELARLLTSRPHSDAAIAALAALGPRAKDALPDLVAYISARGERRWGDSDFRYGAIRAIGCLGADAASAVPLLVSISGGEDESLRHGALDALADIGIVRDDVTAAIVAALRHDDSVRTATLAAERLGVRTPEVFAALAGAIRVNKYACDEPARLLVSLAISDVRAAEEVAGLVAGEDWIWELGESVRSSPPALAGVSELLLARTRSEDVRSRAGALQALVWLGAPAARDAGLALLATTSGVDRQWAIAALAKGGPPDAATLSALANAVKDADVEVVHEALIALGKLGPAAASVSKEVVTLLDDPARRDDAADALARMGVRDERVVASVVERLGSTDVDVRTHAVWVLADLGDAARSEIPRLAALMNTGDQSAYHSATALARLGAVAPLLAAIREDTTVAGIAREVLAAVPATYLAAVCGFTTDPSDEVRATVAKWLGRRGGERGQAELVRLLADRSDDVRVAAAKALGGCDGLLPASVAALRDAVASGSNEVRTEAARSLAKSDPAAAAEALFEIWAGSSNYAHLAGTYLAELGPDARSIAPRFVERLHPPLWTSKALCAMRALTSFPSEARAATPELAAIVSRRVRSAWVDLSSEAGKEQVEIRVQAAVLLGDFGGPGATESLREALLDPSRDVRDAAKAALAKLGAR